MFESSFYGVLFFAIPVLLLMLLGVSIYRYVSAKKQNKAVPETFSVDEMQRRKLFLVVCLVIVGVLLVVVGGFIALMFMAVAFM